MDRITLADVKRANPIYFGKGQKGFFNDISYKVRTGKDGQKYLVTETYGFTDMFGAENRRRFWTAKKIDADTLALAPGMEELETAEAVEAFLKG